MPASETISLLLFSILICFSKCSIEQELWLTSEEHSIHTHTSLRICENDCRLSTSTERETPHLFDVVIQGDNGEGGGEIGIARDSCAQRSRLRDESMISGHLEIRRLIVLIKHLNVEISERRKRVSVILLCLEKRMP